jgi:hypothetical protein
MRRMNAGLLFLALISSGRLTLQSHNSVLVASELAPLGGGAAGGVSVLPYLAMFLAGMAVAAGLIWVGWRWRRRLEDNEVRRLERPPADVSIGMDNPATVEQDMAAERPTDSSFSATLR